MRINVAVPEAHVSADVLDAALESVTRLNESMLDKKQVPTFSKALHYGIKWKPEPPGAEHFDHAGTVLARKWGDCDDLAPWEAASLRHTGDDPGARAVAKRSGPNRWHAVVQRSDGTITDPSKRAGMGQPSGVVGAALPLMYPVPAPGVNGAYIIRPQIAARPVRGAVQARADLPWYWREHLSDTPTPTDRAMTALHTAPTADTALVGALDGIIDLAEAAGFAHPNDVQRLKCISDACAGMSLDELAGHYSDDDVRAAQNVVGSFFSSLAKVARGVVSPIAHTVLPFVPGVGPILDKGLSFAEHAIPGMHDDGGGGGQPGAAAVQQGQPQHRGGMRGFKVEFY